jgi:DNA (cytosine-5)-methyltransferase 1
MKLWRWLAWLSWRITKEGGMNELALFAGAGGGILGGHLLGWRTVCAVEWEAYPASVLCARQNDGFLPPFPVWDNVQTFDGKPWKGIVDVISGGFPCQDISSAGKGAGIDGERSGMWREMARIIGEVRPRYAFVENSPMLVTRGLERVLADLTAMGYDSRWGVVSAADVGANHKRERIWIVANSKHSRHSNQVIGINEKTFGISQENWQKWSGGRMSFGTSGMVGEGGANWLHNQGNLACTSSLGQSRQGKYEQSISSKEGSDWQANIVKSIGTSNFWEVEPNVGRVADGVAARMDRLKAIGNGQVPLCAAIAWKILSELNEVNHDTR